MADLVILVSSLQLKLEKPDSAQFCRLVKKAANTDQRVCANSKDWTFLVSGFI